jgi:galactose mutarotase-like enzyme
MRGSALTITTSVRATGEVPVPVSFGFHPYLRLPGLERSAWEIEVPVREGLTLDAQMLPTGSREPVTVEAGALGSRNFDNAYTAPPDSLPFVLSGGGRRIEASLEFGYPYAQVYAPLDDDVVAFEPMTTPTNALVDGESKLPLAVPGAGYRARFSIRVIDAPAD